MAEPAAAVDAPPIQPAAYDEAGRPVAADDIPRAVAEGRAFFQQGAKIYARNPNGALVTVSAEDVHTPGYTVLSPTELHQEVTQRKYGNGAGNAAKALAYGAARGLTLSGSDVLAAEIGGKETAEEIEGLKSAHPYISGAGEIAGAAAPLLLSGGAAGAAEAGNLARAGGLASDAVRTVGFAPRLASRAGSLVERGVERGLETLGYEGKTVASRVLAKAASGAAGGAAEAALYGAGHGTAEQVLAGDDVSAEKILATMRHEALWGAGIGGALAGAGAGIAEGGRLVAKRGASTELADFARERALKTVGRDTEKIGKGLPPEARANLRHSVGEDLFYKIEKGEYAGQRIIDGAESPEQVLGKLSAAKRENGAALGGLKDELNGKMLEAPELGPKLEELQKLRDDVVKEFRARGTQGSMSKARAAEREFDVFLKQHAPDELEQLGLVNLKYSRDGMRDLTGIRKAYDGASPAEAELIATGQRAPMGSVTGKPFEPVNVDIWPEGTIALRDGRHRMTAAQEAGATHVLAQVRHWDAEGNILSEEIRPVSIQPRASAGPTFLEVDKFRQALDHDLNPAGVPKAMRAMALGPKAEVLDRVTRGLSDYLKDKAGVALAKLGEDPGAYSELSRKYASFKALETIADKTVSASAKNRTISPSDHALGIMGFLGSLLTGNVGALGSMGVGAAASIANKLVRERGNSLLASWARGASQIDGRIELAAKKLAGARVADDVAALSTLRRVGERGKTLSSVTANEALPGAAPSDEHSVPRMEPASLSERYQKTAARVRELSVAENAQQHMSTVLAESFHVQPEVSGALSMKLLGVYQHLAQKLPPSSTEIGTTLTPLAIKERVSPADQRAFLEATRGALDPMSIVDDLAKGLPPSREAVASMKEIYPKLFEQLRGAVADEVSQRAEELPYKRRVMLSMTFDFTGDSSLEPARMAGLQEVAQSLSFQEAAQDAAAIKPRLGDPGVSKLGKSLTTPMDSALGGTS